MQKTREVRRDTRLKPTTEFRVYRRNLPHVELTGSVYFITFRTTDGFTLSESAKDITFNSIKFHAGKKYELYACVVMETHVHVVLQPLQAQAETPVPPNNKSHSELFTNEVAFYSIGQIMHSIKSYSANRIQRVLHKKGAVWLDENYDRIIRDEKECLEKLNYIANNPVKAGLVEKPEDYQWLYFGGKE